MGAALLFGGCIALQSRINGELGRQLGDGYLAALISFGSGLVLLVGAMAVWRPGRVGLARVWSTVAERRVPAWYVLGGTAGAFFVLAQGLTASVLGVALFTVATVSGQILSGLVIDRRGLGTMAASAPTVPRLIGSALVLVAVALAVSTRFQGDIPVWMLIMPLLVGVAVGWQQAVNGQVRIIANSVLTATFVNFAVGTTVLAVAMLVHVLAGGVPRALPTEPWLYVGGLIGIVFIAGAAVAVRITGVLLLGLSTIAGQLLISLVIDVAAPAPGQEIAWTTIAGTAVAVIAVGIAAIPGRRMRPRPGA
ncbi:DMT family transporter [Planctomonas psychrotolerans]|uniref:DMT family transporter n=1 Tax=Planctomonas psychrotolerans TaxID=2528712 RepID=UPI001D0D0B0B|nr:DMT family transporter [Planctomonas psychrotolerans]